MLEVKGGLLAAPRRHAVAAERPVARDHPVAVDQQPDRVAPDGPAPRPGRPRPPDPPRHLAVARYPATRDRVDRLEDQPIPGRPVGDVHRQRVDPRRLAREPPLHQVPGPTRPPPPPNPPPGGPGATPPGRAPGAGRRVLERDELAQPAPADPGLERVRGC